MFAIGSIEAKLQNGGDQMIIPKSAVLWTGPRSVVYVKLPDAEAPTFRLRQVTLGASLGNSYIVEDGLEPGEEIVVNGTYTIDAASELADKPSMMDQEQAMQAEPFAEVPDYRGEASSGFRQKLNVATQHYLEIQQSLVNADDEAARMEAKALMDALPPAVGVGLGAVAESYWQGRHEGIRQSASQIATGKSIDNQRKAFVELSLEMVRANKAFGVGEVRYLVFCPMANNDKGAWWLSEVEEVLNPYYGDMMLDCGEVKGVIGE
jgi:Cu(I)/Ag(I) efflux system membrane fusion protein